MYLDMNEDDPDGHNYKFVGRAGRFCPILPGRGGGVLYREKEGKYYAVTGTSGYRWLESEVVERLEKQGDINPQYYEELARRAIETISEYGDFDAFVGK